MLLDDIIKQYSSLSKVEQEEFEKKILLEKDGERILPLLKQELDFVTPPPTPQQFLDSANGWLPKKFTEDIFDVIKQDFYDIMSGKNVYTTICMYGGTRGGKTFLARLLIIYTIVYIHHLRDATRYFNVSSATKLAIYILSFNFDKIKEVYLNPIYAVLEQSERFVQTKFQDDVIKKQKKLGTDKIVYSKATLTNKAHLTLASGLQLVSGNDEQINLLGSDLLNLYTSEIAYWIENEGATEDKIFQLYTKGAERIKATVGERFLAFTYLDTSANNAESMIENFILKTLSKRENTYFRSRRRWDVLEVAKKNFPQWLKTRQTFQVISGDGSTPARIVDHPSMLANVSPHLIIDVPIDAKPDFEANLIDSIRDIAGIPTSNESKLVQRKSYIEDMFDENLENIEDIIICDSKDDPTRFMWDRVCDKFFVKYNGRDYVLRRSPQELRYVGIDVATSSKGDVLGIAMTHQELSETGVVFICDFAFAIGPGENGINLDAISHFISDLYFLGNTPIQQVNTDTYQSENIVQFLERKNITVKKTSVDKTINPYVSLLGCLASSKIKAGPNIFLKNNIDSLQRVRAKNGREKIDHREGPTNNVYNGSWDTSLCGQNAKDVSDAVAQCIQAMIDAGGVPSTFYKRQTEKAHIRREIQRGGTAVKVDHNDLRKRIDEARLALKSGIMPGPGSIRERNTTRERESSSGFLPREASLQSNLFNPGKKRGIFR